MMSKSLNRMHYFFLFFLCPLTWLACDEHQSARLDLGDLSTLNYDDSLAGQMTSQDMTGQKDMSMIKDMSSLDDDMLSIEDMVLSEGDISVNVEDMNFFNEDMYASNEQFECETARSPNDRLVAISFPYSEQLGEEGRSLQLFHVMINQNLSPWGGRLELAAKTSALIFSKDGWWLLAVSERGLVTAIDLRGNLPRVHESMQMPLGAYSTFQTSPTPRRFDLINRNNNEYAGLYSLSLDCEGNLQFDDAYYYLRLILGLQRFRSNPNEAIIYGGQALFDPIDPIDLRWIALSEPEITERAQLDVYEDFIDAINVGFSPLDDWAILVNGSPFTDEGGQIRFVRVTRNPPNLEEVQVFEGYDDVRGAWFLPQAHTAFVTQFEENAVQFFTHSQGHWTPAQRVEGIGLASQVAIMPTPNQNDSTAVWILIPTTSPIGGSGVAFLNVLDGESVMTLPAFPLGDGYVNIPSSIASWPNLTQK